MSRPKLKGAQHTASLAEHLKAFRRALHSAGNSRHGRQSGDLRQGLNRARPAAPIEVFPEIVKELAKQSIYQNAFAGPLNPKNLSDLRGRSQLLVLDVEQEFIWTSSVLSLFTDKIRDFLKKKNDFEGAFLAGHYVEASFILDNIESHHGVSIWLIKNRFQVYQILSGLSRQKDYLEGILAEKEVPVIIGFIAYFASFQSEENVFLHTLEAELAEALRLVHVRDYIIYHLLPFERASIVSTATVLSLEEPHSIVDRYLAFVAMAELEFVRNGSSLSQCIVGAIRLLASAGDKSLERILDIVSGGEPRIDQSVLTIFDWYTAGRYEQAIESIATDFSEGASAPDLIEISVKAMLLAGQLPKAQTSLTSQIASYIAEALTFSPAFTRSIQNLQKAALMCSSHPVATHIVAFVKRLHSIDLPNPPSLEDYISALNGLASNPRNIDFLSKLSTNDSYLRRIDDKKLNSKALTFWKLVREGGDAASSEINSLEIPTYRKSLYQGHLEMLAGRPAQACLYYSTARKMAKSFNYNSASKALFDAHMAQARIREATLLLCDQYLERPNTFRLFPIEHLLAKILNDKLEAYGIELPIVLHIAARHLHPRWERELSDAYENFMDSMDCNRPSQLMEVSNNIEQRKLIYFLRHICVPRILDDSTGFEGVEDIDRERIVVCQKLLELDPAHSDIYSAEIKERVRDAEIFTLSRAMDETRIYVNDAGVKDACEERLRPSFARYQEYLRNPSLSYQSDKISKQLAKLLGDRSAELIKDLRIPVNELDAMFSNILTEFGNEFALNPAYGLDTHLSTSIRHGAFEGHLRSPIATRDLLAVKDSGGKYVVPARWTRLMDTLQTHEYESVSRQIIRFSERVDDILSTYRRDKLQIRSTDVRDQGLFNFLTEDEERERLQTSVGSSTSYDEFVERLSAFFWLKIDKSLEIIRSQLKEDLLVNINAAFATLIGFLESLNMDGRVAEIMDAAISARTDFQATLSNVTSWFRRPSDFERESFDIDVAVGVAQKQIENCYVKKELRVEQSNSIPFPLHGNTLEGLVEILFILFQNIIVKGGFENGIPPCQLNTEYDGDDVVLTLVNQLSPTVDIEERRVTVAQAVERYRQDTALKMARKEGGSGLSKVWRILEYDIAAQHQLDITIDPALRLRVRIRFNASAVKAC